MRSPAFAGQYDLGEDLIGFPNNSTNPLAFDPDGTNYAPICTNNLNLNAQTVCKTGGVAVFAYNNYGALTVQAKGSQGFRQIVIDSIK